MVDPTRIFREKRSKNEEKWLDLIPPFISPMIGGTQDRDEVGCQLTRLPQLAAPLCSIFSSISNFFFLIYYFNPSIVLCIFYTPSVLTTGLHPFPEWEYEEKLSLSSAGPSYLKNSFRWTVFCTGIWVFTIIYHFTEALHTGRRNSEIIVLPFSCWLGRWKSYSQWWLSRAPGSVLCM